ncbi:MAG: type IV pili twitching motility protein PilT, partial [Campylobacterota bacterium]
AIFPNDEQNRVRLSLAGVLKGVISQRLIPTVDDKRVAAMEILVKTPTIEKLILENRDYEIREAIEKGREHYKSQSFDQHILDIYNQGIITKEKAKDYATSASDLELRMSGLNSGKAADFINKSENNGKSETITQDDVFDLK